MPYEPDKPRSWPTANSTWFNFTIDGKPSFHVFAFEGTEEVHTPYEFAIELVSTSASEHLNSYIGRSACLSIKDRSGDTRLVHGLIRRIEQLHTAHLHTHYRCYLVPRLWFLGQITDHRIFQDLSVVEIISQLLDEHGFTDNGYTFNLFYTYPPREYCVQYGESLLHFISRLCEEEGIYYYFEHTEDAHALCFCDREGGPEIPGECEIRYVPGSGQLADTATISRITVHEQANSNAVAFREWNFTAPQLNLGVKIDEQDPEKAPVPSGMRLEQYRYPHLYQSPDKGGSPPGTSGQQYAQIELFRQLTYTKWITGESDVSRFIPSYVFGITNHIRDDINTGWWITRTTHYGEQPQVLGHEAPERGMVYRSTVTAIPPLTRFVPELRHPKRLVTGTQTAIVTGPEGEEIYPDEYGRVKIQFFWDRSDQWNDKATCWVRVAQSWAGSQFGTVCIPRVGHEVVVTFLEGNPDRPLITGEVYHAGNMPPYPLPEHKTRTVFKSMSTPGSSGSPRGFNELRLEDKAGQEEIYIHAQKDMRMHVKNDKLEHIVNDWHRTAENNAYLAVQGEEHEQIKKARKIEIGDTDNLTVKGNAHADYKQKWLAKAGQEIHFKSGLKLVLEAATDITLKVGGSFIRLTPAGLTMSGPLVKLNSGGSAGSGSGASPALPESPLTVETSELTAVELLTGATANSDASALAATTASVLYSADEGQAPPWQVDTLRQAIGAPYCAICEAAPKE